MKRKLFSFGCCLVMLLTTIFTSCKQDVSVQEMVKISYVSEFGTLAKTEKIVKKGYKLKAKDLPTLMENGYIFDKWYINKEEATEGTVISKDTVLIAKWTETYTVTFDAKGHGTAPNKITEIISGSKIEKPTDPTVNGFTFEGWCKEAECKNVWNFDVDRVTKNITLYAKWSPKVSDVTFTQKGDVDYLDEVTLSCETEDATMHYAINDGVENTSTKSVTLQIKEDCTVTAYATKNGMTNSDTTSANYKIKTYTVTFNANGYGIEPLAISNIKKGEKVTEPDKLTTTEDVTFEGWYKETDCINPWEFGSDTISSNVTLYAKWTSLPKVSDVTFTKIGAVDYLDEVTLSCKTEGATIHYAINDGVENTSTKSITLQITEDCKITAYATKEGMTKSSDIAVNYNIITYSVEFDTNGKGMKPRTIYGLKKGDKLTVLDEPCPTTSLEFKGWYKEAECTNPWDISKDTVTSDITLYAKWGPKTVVSEVTFSKTGNVDYNDEVILSCTTPGATIHYSINYEKEITSTNESVNVKIEESCTIRAYATKDGKQSDTTTERFTIITYMVRFDRNGHEYGAAPSTVYLKKGDIVTKPEDPYTNDDVEFKGWYKEAGCTNPWDFSKDTVSSDITLYAKWKPKNMVSNVIFDKTGEVDYNEEVLVYCNTRNATIHYTIDNGKEETCSNHSKVKITGNIIKAYATYKGMNRSEDTTAYYTIKTYTVNFDANGHGTSPSEVSNLRKGDKLNKPDDLTTTEEFTFEGWYKEADYNTPWNFDTDTVSSNITLYAKWTPWAKVSDVTFSKTGEVDYLEEVTLSCATDGATIHYTVDNGSEQIYNPSSKIKITGNKITAYATKNGMKRSADTSANYTIKTYTVKFIANGHGTEPSEISNLRKGDKVNKPDNFTTTEEFTFEGWYKEAEFTNLWKFDTDTISSNITLYAKWTPWEVVSDVTFSKTDEVDLYSEVVLSCATEGATIHYSINNGIENTSSTSVSLQIKEACTITAYATKDNMTRSTDTTATYTIKTYTVIFNNKFLGSAPANIQNVKFGSKISKPTDLKATNYKFIGWYKDAACTSQWNFETDTVCKDITLYAKWNIIYNNKEISFGDIILSDGNIVPVSNLSQEQKAKAVAVVCGLHPYGKKLMGLGLKQKEEPIPHLGMFFTFNDESFQCQVNGKNEQNQYDANDAGLTIYGDQDGSDNWKEILRIIKSENKSEYEARQRLPAFVWAEGYGKTYNLPSGYQDGWYIPSIKELTIIYRYKAEINASLEKLGVDFATPISEYDYWSCSLQDADAWKLRFDEGLIGLERKTFPKYVLCIHSFQ